MIVGVDRDSMGDALVKNRRSWRVVCLCLIAVLYAVSIPWYRHDEAPLRIWLGLPDWVAVALFCYVGVAVFNCVAWLLADVSDELSTEDEPSGAAVEMTTDSGHDAGGNLG